MVCKAEAAISLQGYEDSCSKLVQQLEWFPLDRCPFALESL